MSCLTKCSGSAGRNCLIVAKAGVVLGSDTKQNIFQFKSAG